MVALLWLVVASPARSADATDQPPALRGDVSMRWDGGFTMGSLREEGEKVGRRSLSEQHLQWRIEFAPVDGLSAWIALPYSMRTMHFKDGHEMAWDPVTETGTYLTGRDDALDVTHKGKGIDGIWFGIAAAPFNQRYGNAFQANWRLDLAIRSTSKKTWYDGGPALGGLALEATGAFSREQKGSAPYAVGRVHWEANKKIDVTSANETTEVQLKPGLSIDGTAGVELVASKDDTVGRRIAVDLHAGITYRSWQDQVSGFELPSVLEQSKEIPVTTGDHLVGRLGIGVVADVMKYVGFRIGVEARYFTPYRLEHPYPVWIGPDTIEIAPKASLVGRYR